MYINVLLASTRENSNACCQVKVAWWIIMRLFHKRSSDLLLCAVNCHLFSSREGNAIKVNSTGGLCCILACNPLLFLSFFFIWYLCAKSRHVLPTVATNTKPTWLSIPDTKLQSSQVPGGKLGFSVSVCDVLRMATNCCAACQRVKPGALEREKWKINWCHLPRRSRDCDTWERW